jgi:superfamily II DNA or RNA helicase
MKPARRSEGGWDLEGALAALRSGMDPYIWEQGQELFRRGAGEDFAILKDGTVQVKVLDPRDARTFFVTVEKGRSGEVSARCACPYRLGSHCRHQVVGLEYLKAAISGEADGEEPPPAAAAEAQSEAPAGPVLYRLFDADSGVATMPDGSLLRVILQSLGSSTKAHRLSLQLYGRNGWTEMRHRDLERWIQRGRAGPHPRDAWLAAFFAGEGGLRSECDSEELARLLHVLAGSHALADRTGSLLPVSPWPWRLAARLVRAGERGLGLELACRSSQGEERPFGEVALVPSVSPWIQLESGAFHPLVAGAPGPLLEGLQGEDYSEIAGGELERFLAEGVAQIERLCPGALETEPDLIREVEGVDGARLRLEGGVKRLEGALELAYGGEWVPAPDSPASWSLQREGKILRFPPAGQSLARAHRELEALGFRRDGGRWVLEGAGILAKVLLPRPRAFVRLALPAELEAFDAVERPPLLELAVEGGGWSEGSGRAPGAPAGEAAALPRGGEEAGRPRRGSGIDWFEVSFRLTAGGRELPGDLTELRGALERDPAGLLELEDGTVLSLAHEAVRELADLADSASGAAAGASRLRLPLAAAGELLEERPEREVTFDAGLRPFVESLTRWDSLPLPPLRDDIENLLRPYQRQAVRWFGQLARWGLAGLLADEMGLGKTLMALAHLFGHEQKGGDEARRAPVLVVCPTSLIFNWLDECRRFFPHLRAVGLQGLPAAARDEAIRAGADLLVTSYALLRRDREALEARELRAVILDEAQHVKNPESQTAKAACALRAGERWVLTGTPVENRLTELWSLFHFLMPGFLGGAVEFQRRFAEPIGRREDGILEKLRARVRPFLLRRTKEQVLSELPPRIEQVERVPMTELQRRLYEAQLLAARAEVEGAAGAAQRFKVLAALTRLRQICCHPRLVLAEEGDAEREAAGDAGGKFELLMELLEECIEEGHRVLLFSQFTSMLDIIDERLRELGVARCRLDGSTRDREAEVRRFARESSIPLFLISLKAGGFGLNLTQADTVVLYDPWWNPAAEEQAAARAHRLGQTLPVHVHKLITAETVEEKILELQARKRALASSIIRSEEEALEVLNVEELRSLLYD